MAEWSRENPWRQCHFIPLGLAGAIGLISNHNEIAILVSHSCDIAQSPEVEPKIEVLKGYIIPDVDGNNTQGKNARILHISAKLNGDEVCIEFRANEKTEVEKGIFADHSPDTEYSFTPLQQRTIQQWLAARYRRNAFPTEFDRRLSSTKLGSKIKKKLSASQEAIRAIYVDIDGQKELTRPAGEPYEIKIYLIYDVDKDPAQAADIAQKVCKELENEFRKSCFNNDKWEHFELISCQSFSASTFPVQMTYALQRWTLDYLSLRSNDDKLPE